MQCVTDLAKLRDSIISRVRCLRQIASPITAPLGSEDGRALAFVNIKLDNLVILGLRQYTKSSLLRSRTAAGVRISAAVKPSSTEEAAAFVYRSLRPDVYSGRMKSSPKIKEKEEVAFRDPKEAEKVLLDYSAPNLINLSLALSLNADVFQKQRYADTFLHTVQKTHTKPYRSLLLI